MRNPRRSTRLIAKRKKSGEQLGMQVPPSERDEREDEVTGSFDAAGACGYMKNPIFTPFTTSGLTTATQQQYAWPPMVTTSFLNDTMLQSPPLMGFTEDFRPKNDENPNQHFGSVSCNESMNGSDNTGSNDLSIDWDQMIITAKAASTPKLKQTVPQYSALPPLNQQQNVPLKTLDYEKSTLPPFSTERNDKMAEWQLIQRCVSERNESMAEMQRMQFRMNEMQKAMNTMILQNEKAKSLQYNRPVMSNVNIPAKSQQYSQPAAISTFSPAMYTSAETRYSFHTANAPAVPTPTLNRPIVTPASVQTNARPILPTMPQSRAYTPEPFVQPAAGPVGIANGQPTRQYTTLTSDGAQIVNVYRNAAGEQYAELVPVKPAAAVPVPCDQTESEFGGSAATSPPARSAFDCESLVHDEPVLAANAYGTREYKHRRIYDLPTFSGRPEEWPKFVNAFTTTTEAFAYNDLENMIRLQKALTGDAKQTVECLLIHPRHVNNVISTLRETFGRPELLVRSQIDIARRLPTIAESRLDLLGPFSVKVQNLSTFLDTEETQHHLENPMLLEELIAKLPISRRMDWAAVAIGILPHPTVRDFARWLAQVARLANLVELPTKIWQSGAVKPDGGKTFQSSKGKHVLLNVESSNDTNFNQSKTDSKSVSCIFCEKAHNPGDCDDFRKLALSDRWEKVTKLRLCFICLRPGHIIPSCSEKVQCGVDQCLRWHHPELHTVARSDQMQQSKSTSATVSNNRHDPAERTQQKKRSKRTNRRTKTPKTGNAKVTCFEPTSSAAEVNSRSNNTTVSILNCNEGNAELPLLFRIVPVVLYGRERSVSTYALLDEGSSLTMIDADVADQLQLDGPLAELNVQWFGSLSSRIESSRKVSVGISGKQPTDHRFDMHNVRTVRNIKLPTQTVDAAALKGAYPHLRHVPITGFNNVAPKILIGLDNHHLGVPLKVETNAGRQGIVAALTNLGWVVYGSDTRQPTSPPAVLLHISCAQERQYAELAETVRAYFTTEDFGVKKPETIIESDEDTRARRLLKSTTKRVDDRFETGLLWRTDTVELPNSYEMALRRLTGVESKMRRDHNYASQYQEQINSYVTKGYARKLSEEEAQQRDSRTWYLPHFAVRNPNKPGKFRLVFDAAATVRGVSLNSALLSGPDVNVPLTKLLFKFRLGLVGICADIREMFHQVRIRAADQNSQRFLWRGGDTKSPPDTYVMEVMTFGSTCSPASAQYVKNVNAGEFADESPAAADAIQRSHYVDDYVASFATPEEAAEVTAAVVELHRRGGFELRGFVCNDRSVLKALGAEVVPSQPVSLEPESTNAEKILGMSWDTETDCFLFLTRFSRVSPDVMSGEKIPSKREILSASMSVFDPFGLLSEFMLAAKLILQDLWQLGLDWDEAVPDSIKVRWQAWCTQIERTRLCRVPRCYSPQIQTTHDLQLHVFADASEVAFAAVAYWRVVRADGQVDLAFVAGKTKCAPLKILTVPRLELQAAVLATRLMTEIRECHDLTISKVVLWTDSRTVLHWIRSDQRKYKPFVAFRVAEITDSTMPSWWRWLPTTMNVADDATRVKEPLTFDPESRWLRGPEWLHNDEVTWPEQPNVFENAECAEEVRTRFVGIARWRNVIDFDRFSRYVRLCRAVAWAVRFTTNARAQAQLKDRVRGELNADEVNAAVNAVCRLVQQEVYSSEYAALKDDKPINASSDIFSAKPYLDNDGLMRLHGRADAANDEHLPQNAKRPIILPRSHRFTELLVRHYHELMAHQLEDATIAAVRQEFWIPQLRTLVQYVRRSCLVCKIRTAKPTTTALGQLPSDRLTPYVRPFTFTGLDYFGPVNVTVGRRQEKRWVALFTCLTVRAVHMEVAADLSTDACLVCIRNFCNIRGVPVRIRCDNGTNFVGARNEMGREQNLFDERDIQKELTTRGIDWKFNCPANPEAGGAWERMVQSAKRVLAVTLKEVAPRVETLRSLLLEAANIINSRPLTHIPVDPADCEPLTPNHFLLGGPSSTMVPGTSDQRQLCSRKQWKVAQQLTRTFWQQWVRDYLPELTRRSRHYPEVAPLKIGDLVIIIEDNQPRSRWARGRVINTMVGPDGMVRTAEVHTGNGTLRRPVTKLAVLDVEESASGVSVRGPGCRQLVRSRNI